ncbi:MAG: septum site-determining protein MinC [Chloroflexi bacterium]|nr:septum site-determining protein MinC [Chloroflexota bacterium]
MEERPVAEERVTIRGTRDGLVVILGPGELSALLAQLDSHIAQRPAFFRSGRVALEVGRRSMGSEDLQAVGACLQRWGMSLWAVESDSAETAASARALGLETSQRGPAPTASESSVPLAQGMQGMVLRRTLRSGQSIRYHGHVVLIGDVNPGAEIEATGNVVVWGRLRGMVHAGAQGDTDALICALGLTPTLLRIADVVARAPEGEGTRRPTPEMAFLREGVMVVEPWA